MADQQQGFSRTLPKNFTFPSLFADEPTTPHRASIHLDVPPPPPRPATCRSRRFRVRSGTDVSARAEADLLSSWNSTNNSDIPVPSIEVPAQHETAVAPSCAETGSTSNDRFLAPPQDRTALKTPPAQIRATPVELNTTGAWSTWDHNQAEGEVIERPGSACSHASDSSTSSIETFASRPSVEGSCTSTESDLQDPFFYLELPKKPIVEALPQPAQNVENNKSQRRQKGARDRWTVEMDSHLWNTYQLYIQDPTITPFKMTPGSIPPLGVTHRVSREAKKRWDWRTFKFNRQFPFGVRQSQKSNNDGSATPTPKSSTNGAAKKPGWPKSETSTRRRLKLLCRRKFSIAPHYQRLMMDKTPEPSTSSPESSSLECTGANSTAFTTRDLGMSLVSSSIPEPLSQLAADSQPQDAHVEFSKHLAQRDIGPEKPAAAATANPVARKSLGLDRPGIAPRLGSPFTYHTWGPDRSKRRIHRHSPMGRRETIHVTGGFRLQSPPRMDLFSSLNNSNQQQVQEPPVNHQITREPDTYSHLEDFASQGKLDDLGNRRVRIRNRGATTSAVNSRAVHQLFSPPSSSSKNESSPQEKRASSHRRNLSGESIKRLGSPFRMDAPKRPQSSSSSLSRAIRHAPSSSDPFVSQVSEFKSMVHPHDATEPGLSDAERIRRQILNMAHSRR